MSKLNGFILSCALVLVAGTASSDMTVEFTDANSSTVIPNVHIESISIDHVNNVISIATSEDYVVELAEEPCTVDCGEPVPTITSFLVSSPVPVGDSTTISWASANATSCTASGNYTGWQGNLQTSNDGKSVVMNTVGTFTLGLTCSDGVTDTTTLNRTVVVEGDVVVDPEPESACPVDYVAPLSGTSRPWENFWPEEFPLPGYDNDYATILRYGYYALEFSTADIVDTGKFMTVESTTTSGSRFGSVSVCEGDFDVADECKFVWGTSGGIIWSTEGYDGACELDPNTTYYFNVTFTDGFNDTSSTCNDSKCITKLRVYNP